MDPITTAIVAALPALGSDLIKSTVKEAYVALKAMIRSKWGDTSPVASSVDALEENPKSKAQAEVLAEHVAAVNATGDADVMQAVARLVDLLKKEKIGGPAIAQITINISGGNVQGVVGAQNVSVETMNFGMPAAHKKT